MFWPNRHTKTGLESAQDISCYFLDLRCWSMNRSNRSIQKDRLLSSCLPIYFSWFVYQRRTCLEVSAEVPEIEGREFEALGLIKGFREILTTENESFSGVEIDLTGA